MSAPRGLRPPDNSVHGGRMIGVRSNSQRGSAGPALYIIFDVFAQDTELSSAFTKGDCEEMQRA